MCTGGVNLTQFKLSLHQLEEMMKVCEKGLEQWGNLLSHLQFETLVKNLENSRKKVEEARREIEKTLREASHLEHAHESEPEITPM